MNQVDNNPLSYDQVIARANEKYANIPFKDKVIERIKKRLNDFEYQKQQEAGKGIEIVLEWEDTLWAIDKDEYTEEQINVIRLATGILQGLPGVEVSQWK